jgi:hypothetical protein
MVQYASRALNSTKNGGYRVPCNMQVTTGEEGFWPQGSLWAPFNPWGQGPPQGWAYSTGQDFSAQHASPDIDFAVMHLWPDNWAELFGRRLMVLVSRILAVHEHCA